MSYPSLVVDDLGKAQTVTSWVVRGVRETLFLTSTHSCLHTLPSLVRQRSAALTVRCMPLVAEK
jgi:hypothetical protein